MLANIEFSAMIPVHDMERARKFYQDKLGLPLDNTPGGPAHRTEKGTFVLYESQGAGKAEHTLMSWTTDNLDVEVAALRNKGIVFEEYDMPGLKTQNGIAVMGDDQMRVRVAWFKDSEGNILGIAQFA